MQFSMASSQPVEIVFHPKCVIESHFHNERVLPSPSSYLNIKKNDEDDE